MKNSIKIRMEKAKKRSLQKETLEKEIMEEELRLLREGYKGRKLTKLGFERRTYPRKRLKV